ncbi:MAG: alkaline phosphatase D family protein [Planctomycetota bacterium]|nr:alkaline phosphatase D family protein [Planctomycetota bacterium]
MKAVLFSRPGCPRAALGVFLPAFVMLAGLPLSDLFAQHDGARNAVQRIARGEHNQVEKVLAQSKKPFAGEAESHFVRMLNWLSQDEVEMAFQEAQSAVKAGLPFERLLMGPRRELSKLHASEDFRKWRAGIEVHPVIAGPMIGNLTSSSLSIWLRTANPMEIDVRLYDSADRVVGMGKVTTRLADDCTGKVTLAGLQPDTGYRYEVGTPAIRGDFRTRPRKGSPGKFRIAFGGGAGYVPRWERMWDTIREQNPDTLLMLGDNVYIDQPEFSLCQHYCYYRRQCRPEWKRLVSSTPVYSIWDDHDFATNDCNTGPYIDQPAWKPRVWNTFTQNWVNPGFGGGKRQPGCWYDFHIGDVHLIMLDGRYYRHREGKTMLGPVQKKWLKQTLAASEATFKLLVSPVPFTPRIKPGSKDPWDGFPEEREEIFSFISSEKIEGVFLVAADRHRTDLRKISRLRGYDLYEFMSSKLTNVHTHPVVKTEGLIWGYNKTCSFGLMEFDTTVGDPEVRMKCVTIDGEVIHEHLLKRSLLE